MNLYYEDEFVTLFCDDARTVRPDLSQSVVLTGPPYFEHLDSACDVIRALRAPIVICQWNEIQKPPCSLPLVAAHIWINADAEGMRYQTFYHFDENGVRRRSAVMQYPTHQRTHPHDFPVALAQCLLMKTPTSMPVFDPFMGSGASLIAAKQLKRKAVGIDTDETRLKMAVERLRETH
jgi:DNA modification methylase